MERPQKLIVAQGQITRASSHQSLFEREMIRRAQNLEEDALSWLYQVYYPKVYNYALVQLGDMHLAEDLASSVMLKILESIGSYKYKGVPFAAWAFRIARNQIIDLHRRRKRRGEVNLDYAVATNSDYDPQPMAERALERSRIQQALQHLTGDQRQVIVLKFIEGFDNGSIARILGRSEGAIKSLQHRALLSLRRHLASGGEVDGSG
ncbi:MAG TPA: sigma-70 family RNA polymerase sigma factor [Dehalococcoidia bacterium]|nr:sigma-70 family RNA polymerase sigma factor [Dehalococcoidia bacterium]